MQANARALSIAEQARTVVAMLESHGVAVPPSSRFDTYERLLDRPDQPLIRAEDPEFPGALEGWIDVQQMAFILSQVPREAAADWSSRLRVSLKDPAVVDPSGTQETPGRDMQYELLVAGVLRKAGLFQRFDEPDVVAQVDGGSFGVACKRLTSPRRLEQALRSARRQIEVSRIPGAVAVDLTVALNRERAPIGAHLSELAVSDLVGAALQGIMDTYRDSIVQWLNTTWVCGLLLQYTSVHCTGEGHGVASTYTLTVPLSHYNIGRRRMFERFAKRFQSGLPTGAESWMRPIPHMRVQAGRFFTEARRNRWRR